MSFSKGDYITNLDDLKRWWDYNQTKTDPKPYFTVYRGPESKPDRVVFRNMEETDVDKAWEMLDDIIEMHTQQGGMFKIYLTTKPGHNIGMQTLYSIQSPYQLARNNYPGIGNIGANTGEKMYSKEDVERERRIWQLEQSIKDLRAEQEAKVGEMEGMMGEFMPIVKDLAHKFGLKMMGYQQPAAHTPAPNMAGQYMPDGNESEGFDYDRIEPALESLQTVFPDTETTIEKLAAWARNNPDMAKQLMSTL